MRTATSAFLPNAVTNNDVPSSLPVIITAPIITTRRNGADTNKMKLAPTPAFRPSSTPITDEREEAPSVTLISNKREEASSVTLISNKREEASSVPLISNKREEALAVPLISNNKREEALTAPLISNNKRGEALTAPLISNNKRGEALTAPLISNNKRGEAPSAPLISNDKNKVVSTAPLIRNKREDAPSVPLISSNKREEAPYVPLISNNKSEVAPTPTLLSTPLTTSWGHVTTSRLPVLTAPDTATEWRQALLSQSLPTTPRSADDDAAGRTPREEIAYTATAAAPSTTTTTVAAATVVVVFRAGAAGAAKQTRSVSYSSPDGADGGETVTNAAVVVDVGDDVLFPSRELVTASAARGPFGSPLVGEEGAGSSNGVRLSDKADVVSRAGPETSFSRNPNSDTLDEPGVRSSRSSSGRTETRFASNAKLRKTSRKERSFASNAKLRKTSRKERSLASNAADRLDELSSSNSRPERSFSSNAASDRLDEPSSSNGKTETSFSSNAASDRLDEPSESSSSNSRTERSFSSNALSDSLDEPSERNNSSSSGGDVFFPSKKERDEASEVSSSSAEEGKGERKEEGEEEERGEKEEEESPRPAAAATDGGVSSAASGGSPAAPSVSSDANERRDGDVSNVSARPTPTLSQSAPALSAATTTTAAAATATRSNVTLSAAGTAGGSRGGIEGEGTRSVTGVKISLDVVATVASESGASHAVGPGNEDVPTIVAWTGAVKRAPDATTTPTITPTISITTTTTTTVVSDRPRATDMAAGNVTPSLQPAEGTAGKATVFYPTNPPAPTTASPPGSDDPQQLFPSNSTTVTVSPGSGDNSSLPLASSNDSLPFDVVTLPASSPGFEEEKESSISTSSAPFLDSTSGFGDAVRDPSTRSDVFNVTTSDPGIPDSSGDVSSGEVIDTTTTTVVAGTTFISPTLPSVSPCSELPPSAAGNGSVFSGEAETAAGVPILAIALPLCLALLLFVGIIIAMSLLCYRRKKKKRKERKSSSHDDLWLETIGPRVPAFSLTIPPNPAPDLTYVTVPGAQTAAEWEGPGDGLYLAVHDFPSQQDTQLPLTPGDVVEVQERADNGWWRGVLQGGDRSGWFPSGFVEPLQPDSAPTTLYPGPERPAEQPTPKPRISSFLVRKKPTNRSLRESNSFSLGNIRPQNTTSNVARSASTLPPVSAVKLATPTTSASLSADDFTTSVKDKYFKALFSYKAAYRGELSLREGEIIVGKERDRNGWMLGRKAHSKEEGWFPAVYVDQVQGDFSLAEETSSTVGSEVTSPLDHEVYGQLAVNRNKSPDQSWLGIEHRAVTDYSGQSDTEMSLKAGDVVTVVEALESGWWLGCHGDQVGWFPGDRVELLEEKSESGLDLDAVHLLPLRRNTTAADLPLPHPRHNHSYNHHPPNSNTNNDNDLTPACNSKRSSLASSVDARDLHDRKLTHSLSRESMLSKETVLSEGSSAGKPRPARKAPKPPLAGSLLSVSGAGGTLSRNPRPSRPAPAPPSQTGRSASVGSVNGVGGPSKEAKASEAPEAAGGAATPRKQKKPKVVRIPKEKVGLDKISSCPAPSGRPPPLSDDAAAAADGGGGGDAGGADDESSHTQHAQGQDAVVSSSDLKQDDNNGEEVTHCETAPRADAEDLDNGRGAAPFEDGGGNVQESSSQNDEQPTSQTDRKDPGEEESTASSVDTVQQAREKEDSDDQREEASGQSLLDEMKLFLPGLTGTGSESKEEPSQNTEESAPESVAYVDTSPTLTVPSSLLPVTHPPADDGGGVADTAGEPSAPPEGEPRATSEEERAVSEESKPVQADETSCDSKPDPDTAASTEQTPHPELSDTFQSPLMASSASSSSSPTSTPRYIRAPPELLEEAEESLVDELPGRSSPAPSADPSSKASALSKPTGYWRFQGSSSNSRNGRGTKQKAVKLNKVAPPVVPGVPPPGVVGEGEVEVPPAGAPGRVSKIVHRINRMASFEEPAPARRTSLQRDPALPLLGAEDQEQCAETDVPQILNAKENPSPSPEPRADSAATADVVASSSSPQQRRESVQENPTQKLHEKLANGGPGSLTRAGRCSPLNDKLNDSIPAEKFPSELDDSVARFPSEVDDSVVKFPSELGDSAEDSPRGEGNQGPQRHSREGTPESEGEGHARRKSSKKARAPPPPKSPPPSSSRKIKKLIVVAPEGASEC